MNKLDAAILAFLLGAGAASAFAPVPPGRPRPAALQGTWVLVKGEATGKHQHDEVALGQHWRIGEREITVTEPGEAQQVGYQLDPSATPKAVDLTFNGRWGGRTFRGIYQLKGDTLRVRYTKGDHRPTAFDPEGEERGTVFLEFKREARR